MIVQRPHRSVRARVDIARSARRLQKGGELDEELRPPTPRHWMDLCGGTLLGGELVGFASGGWIPTYRRKWNHRRLRRGLGQGRVTTANGCVLAAAGNLNASPTETTPASCMKQSEPPYERASPRSSPALHLSHAHCPLGPHSRRRSETWLHYRSPVTRSPRSLSLVQVAANRMRLDRSTSLAVWGPRSLARQAATPLAAPHPACRK